MANRMNKTVPRRISMDLSDWIDEIAKNNQLSKSQASKELAQLRKKLEKDKKRIQKEILI